jgi:hypothetical protein
LYTSSTIPCTSALTQFFETDPGTELSRKFQIICTSMRGCPFAIGRELAEDLRLVFPYF